MNNKLIKRLQCAGYIVVLSLAGGLLSGCDGSNSGTIPSAPPTPPPAAKVSFTTFVKAQLKKPDTATPIIVNGVDFNFPDLNNPHVYDDVLPPQTATP